MSRGTALAIRKRGGRVARPKSLLQLGVTNVVDVGTQIEGNLVFRKSVLFKGEINGDITLRSPGSLLIIAQEATVRGVVSARNIVVQGDVQGEIRCQNVRFFDGSHFEGKLLYERMDVSPGSGVEAESMKRQEYKEPDDGTDQ